ncbi:MAG: hypothetical protein U9R26_10230 [Campylobacterota bacterium]|nr:hypothetical protein [Campylobacterota bacterium]
MIQKTIRAVLLAVTLTAATAIASDLTLKSSSAQLISLAGKQQQLSQKITEAYSKRDKNINIATTIKALEAGQEKLKYDISDPEIDNLFVFLDICLDEMKILVKKPYSSTNEQLISELGASISEGSRYVAESLKNIS